MRSRAPVPLGKNCELNEVHTEFSPAARSPSVAAAGGRLSAVRPSTRRRAAGRDDMKYRASTADDR